MPGFNFVYNSSKNINSSKDSNLIQDKIVGENYIINRFTLNKFIDDKLFEETDEYIIVLEGVILNKIDLLKQNSCVSWSELIWKLYLDDKKFFKALRGSFSGLIFDKKNKEWAVFTDHLGTKHLYYYIEDSQVVVSSEIKDLYNYFKRNDIEYTLSKDSAYALLSYGYMLDDNTLCNEIKKLLPGHYLQIKDNSFHIKRYYELPLASVETSLTEFEIIDELDVSFRRAIKLQFDKDKEYDYQHLVALSGGLDSRMTSWVAHDMGYTNQLNYTFSQSDYLDETIPKQIASDLKHEWIFKALDNGLFLKDLDEINLITGGNALYYGIAHGNSFLKYINFKKMGIIHSGLLGDAVIGSHVKSLSEKSVNQLHGAFSNTLLKKNDEFLKISPEEAEHSLTYRRALNGISNSLIMTHKYTESTSPFSDIDFFEYCLSIPIKLRMNSYIYKKWILKKYPKAADYVWEKTKQKLTDKNINVKLKGRSIPIKNIPRLALRKFGLLKNPLNTKHHMNPLEYWYITNRDIADFQDEYFKNTIDLLKNKTLRKDCEKLYTEGTAIEKNQVLTLLSALKLFF